jgi:hypothetical protein
MKSFGPKDWDLMMSSFDRFGLHVIVLRQCLIVLWCHSVIL